MINVRRSRGVVMSSGSRAASSPLPAAQIKGSAFREFLRWYRERFGDTRVRALTSALPPEIRRQIDPSADAFGILASTWYPAPIIHALCDAVVAGLDERQQSALAREASRVLMDATLRGLYRFLFEQLASPARIVMLAPRIWRTYFDSGERTTEIVSAARHDGVIQNWRGHHPFLCAVQVHATTSLYEAAGCRNVATTPLDCVSNGATRCRWSTTWQR
ncbi:MAG: hypothetical protein IPJ34_25840 [Myxococcales bacterium]|nr:hypothetical protein [Myxococcales bacterium]